MTLQPFAFPAFRQASSLLWPLLTPRSLSLARPPRVRTCTFDPCRQALPCVSFGDCRISRSLARSSPTPGLSACFCSYGRVFATPCFQSGLAASTLGFATLVVTPCGYLLSGNKYMPMSGTRGFANRQVCERGQIWSKPTTHRTGETFRVRNKLRTLPGCLPSSSESLAKWGRPSMALR